MDTRTHMLCIALCIALSFFACMSSVFAHSVVPSVDNIPLPTINVFVPDEHRNVPIHDLSFAELDAITMTSAGRQWNDMDALCSSMQSLYGAQGSGCEIFTPHTIIRPVTARAYASFTILPRPVVILPPKPIMIVDPVYPPWSPTYNPYW